MTIRHQVAVLALVATGCSSPPQKSEQPAHPPPPPVRITQFYAMPPRIAKGEAAQLCYGVDGASTVRLEPPADRVWPAQSRCFEVKPAVSTTYTLSAGDASGRSVTEKATVEVGPARARKASAEGAGSRMIQEVTVNKLEVASGEQVTVCYTAHGAASVAIRPGEAGSQSAERGCITDRPTHTTTYQVVATGADGRTDSERVTVKVR